MLTLRIYQQKKNPLDTSIVSYANSMGSNFSPKNPIKLKHKEKVAPARGKTILDKLQQG